MPECPQLERPRVRWVQTAVVVLLGLYAGLRMTIFLYDRRIAAGEAALARLRPAVVEAVQAQERDTAVKAQQQFVEALAASVVAWEPVCQRLASAIPPTMVLHTILIDETQVTLHGVLRSPPAEPEAYLATIAAALKRQGVFRTVTVALGPRNPDEPSVVRVDVHGALR